MNTIFDILRRPIVTEKTNYQSTGLHQYTFEVKSDAKKGAKAAPAEKAAAPVAPATPVAPTVTKAPQHPTINKAPVPPVAH